MPQPLNSVTTTASQYINTHSVETGVASTTTIGQATSASVSFHEGPNTHKKQGVLYAPFAAQGIVSMAIGHNMVRAPKDKPFYPLICRNEQDRATIEQFRTKYLRALQDRVQENQASLKVLKPEDLKKYAEKMVQEGRTEEEVSQKLLSVQKALAKFEQEIEDATPRIDALTKLTIKSSDALNSLSPDQHKLYVLGHGAAGYDTLVADSQCQQGMATAKEIAHQLAEGGLDKRFTDIRVISCWGADTCEPTSFQRSELERASQPQTQRSGFLGLFGKQEVVAEPFAQTLSNEMKREGFELPIVSGYHGLGKMYSSYFGEHHLRGLPNSEEKIHSSNVREVFLPV